MGTWQLVLPKENFFVCKHFDESTQRLLYINTVSGEGSPTVLKMSKKNHFKTQSKKRS